MGMVFFQLCDEWKAWACEIICLHHIASFISPHTDRLVLRVRMRVRSANNFSPNFGKVRTIFVGKNSAKWNDDLDCEYCWSFFCGVIMQQQPTLWGNPRYILAPQFVTESPLQNLSKGKVHKKTGIFHMPIMKSTMGEWKQCLKGQCHDFFWLNLFKTCILNATQQGDEGRGGVTCSHTGVEGEKKLTTITVSIFCLFYVQNYPRQFLVHFLLCISFIKIPNSSVQDGFYSCQPNKWTCTCLYKRYTNKIRFLTKIKVNKTPNISVRIHIHMTLVWIVNCAVLLYINIHPRQYKLYIFYHIRTERLCQFSHFLCKILE